MEGHGPSWPGLRDAALQKDAVRRSSTPLRLQRCLECPQVCERLLRQNLRRSFFLPQQGLQHLDTPDKDFYLLTLETTFLTTFLLSLLNVMFCEGHGSPPYGYGFEVSYLLLDGGGVKASENLKQARLREG